MKNLFQLKAILFLVLISSQFAFSQKDTYKSLLHQLETELVKSEEDLIIILEKTIDIKTLNTRDSLELIINQITPLVTETKNKRLRFLYQIEMSRNQALHGDIELALETAMSALANKDNGKVDDLIQLFSLIGAYKGRMTEYANALEWHQKALRLCETKKDKSCLAQSYTNIAAIHWALKDPKKVKEYSIKSYNIADSAGNILIKTRASTNAAVAFLELKEYEEAEKWFLKNLTIEEQDTTSMITNYNNMGIMFEELKEYNKSIKYLKKALDLSVKSKNEPMTALMSINLARNNNLNGNNKKAEELYAIGMKKTEATGDLHRLGEAYLSLSRFYETTKRAQKALDYHKKYHDTNDSILGKNQLQAINELEIKYETEKKENEILKLSEDQLKSEVTIATQNRKLKQLSFGLVAFCIIALLSFFLFKQRLQNRKQSELLLAISETQTAERKRISQDLHDSIGGSLALTKSKLQNALSKLKETPAEMDEAILALNSTSNQVRQISHNLMPGELVRFGLVPAINTLLEQLNKEELHAQLYTTQMDERLKPLKEIQLYRIVQEAIQNVLKHAKAKNLYIHLNKHKQHLSLLIEDDGIGILPNSEEGLGFKNIEQRIRMLNGSFTVDSSENKGTTLNIKLPI